MRPIICTSSVLETTSFETINKITKQMGRLFYVLFLTSFILIDQILAGVWECEEDTDCIDGATCSPQGLCQCPHGFTFATNGYNCLKYSIGYGSSCEDDAQCEWLTGKYVCIDGACSCGDGYRYFLGRCLESKGLGETCTRDEECHVANYISAMICSEEGVCVCNEGFYARGDYDCRPEGLETGNWCSLDMDCKMENGFCDREQCAVNNSPERNIGDAIAGISRGIITYEIGTTCSTSEDCEDVANSVCSPLTNECICERGYFFSGGTCIAEIGLNVGCRIDSDCTATSRYCVNGACVCTNAQYYTNDLTGCLRVPSQPTFRCTDSLGCNIYGKNAVCVLENFVSSCKCPLRYKLNEATYLCEENLGDLEQDACVQPSDCGIVNAICPDGYCVCEENFRLVNNTCLPNIGGACDSDSKICYLENGDCVNNICSCDPDYTPTGITTCTKVATGLHQPCDYDLQCNAVIENSRCDNGECTCRDGFAETDDELCAQSKDFGDYCVNLRQCQVGLGENIQCRNSICQCPANMTRNGIDCKAKSSAVSLRESFQLFVYFSIIMYYNLT